MVRNDVRIAFLEKLTSERRELAERRRAQDDPLTSIGDAADRLIEKCLAEARSKRDGMAILRARRARTNRTIPLDGAGETI